MLDKKQIYKNLYVERLAEPDINGNFTEVVIYTKIFKIGYLTDVYVNSCNVNEVNNIICKYIDNGTILKDCKIHFINFIKPVTVYSNLKVYNHKVKQFNKNYGNDKNYTNKIELRIIALDFLSSFKITKKLEAFYNYLKYCNAYKDFNKVRI